MLTPSIIWGEINPEPKNLIVKENSHFKADIEIQHKNRWENVKDNHVLFTEDGVGFKSEFTVQNTNYETGKNGPVRMSLNQSFYHELFPRIYALAFGSDNKDALIPNEPYTPMIESVSLNYTASTNMNLNASEKDFKTNGVKLFHEHPFGQAEEHLYLKNQLDFLNNEEKKHSFCRITAKVVNCISDWKKQNPPKRFRYWFRCLRGAKIRKPTPLPGSKKRNGRFCARTTGSRWTATT